jgi:hypothetical protein
MADITLAGLVDIGGYSRGGNVLPDPDNSWRIASAYRLHRIQPMELIHPRPESGEYAAWRWADSNMDHEVKISWVGNDAPYRVSVIRGPAGCSIGGVATQTFIRTAIAGTDLYEHSLPENFAVFKCPTSGLTQGVSYNVRIVVESQSEVKIVNFSFTLDDTKSVWFSGTGNDANAGTFANPKQTFGHGYGLTNSDQKIYRYLAGTYIVNSGTELNNASLTNKCKSYIGAHAGVVFNFDTGHITTGGDDITIMGVKTVGGRPDVGNVRQFDFRSRCRRVMFHDVEFETNAVGTNGGDNPAAVFFGNIDPNYHEYISFSDCRLTDGSKTQMFTLFSVRKFSAFNCHAPNMNTTTHNGANVFHLKHGFQDCTLQFLSASGRTDTGLIWVSSQEPALCDNIDVSFSVFDYAASNTGFNAMRLNGQVSGAQPNANDLYVQRCAFIARQAGASGSSISAETFGSGLPLAKISACAWQSAGSTFILGTGSENVGVASEQAADVTNLANDKKGIIGHKIYSTLVT